MNRSQVMIDKESLGLQGSIKVRKREAHSSLVFRTFQFSQTLDAVFPNSIEYIFSDGTAVDHEEAAIDRVQKCIQNFSVQLWQVGE